MNKKMEIKLNILKLYKELLLKKDISSLDIENIYIEYLKNIVLLGDRIPLNKESFSKYRYVNCYCYALGIDFPFLIYLKYLNTEYEYFSHNLGFITQEECVSYDPDICLEYLYKDLEKLGIKWYESGINKPNRHGGYKIAVYFSEDDFHFLRQNSDSSWSEKQGYTNRVLKVDDPLCLSKIYKNYKHVKTLEIVKPVIS